MAMEARPWFKFYPRDWRADEELRICSLAARGLWIELLALMHVAKPYGHLLINGQAPTDAQIAVLTGCPSDQITALSGELESSGVFSRTRAGVIYSRRMVRDEKRRLKGHKTAKEGQFSGETHQAQDIEEEREISLPPGSNNNDPGGVGPPQRPETQRAEARKKEGQGASNEARAHAEQAVEAYNATAKRYGWPEARRITKPRERSILARLSESGGIEGWREAMARAAQSDFLTGRAKRSNGHEGWSPDLDFFLQASSFTKLLEGKYDNKGAPPEPVSRETIERTWRIFLERKRDGKALPQNVREEDIPPEFIRQWEVQSGAESSNQFRDAEIGRC